MWRIVHNKKPTGVAGGLGRSRLVALAQPDPPRRIACRTNDCCANQNHRRDRYWDGAHHGVIFIHQMGKEGSAKNRCNESKVLIPYSRSLIPGDGWNRPTLKRYSLLPAACK